jgi:hypothetical protein
LVVLLLFLRIFEFSSIEVEVNSEKLSLQNYYYLKSTDTIRFFCNDSSTFGLILPLPHYYDNLEIPQNSWRILTDRISYQYLEIGRLTQLNLSELEQLPSPGTFYISINLEPERDIISCREHLHFIYPHKIIQFVIRPGDQYLDYLMELINTPFIMAPHFTPEGYHQTDNHLGSDCASFALYGKRRQGSEVNYVYPQQLTRYLLPIYQDYFVPQPSGSLSIYQSVKGQLVHVGQSHLSPGDIIHFGEQVSVFCRDLGIPGILDSKDLVIQSWFNQPGIFSLENCGFFGNPVQVYKWDIN